MSNVKTNSIRGIEAGPLDSLIRAVSKREIGFQAIVAVNHTNLSGSGVTPEINASTAQTNAPIR